jgi:hypothetical protein
VAVHVDQAVPRPAHAELHPRPPSRPPQLQRAPPALLRPLPRRPGGRPAIDVRASNAPTINTLHTRQNLNFPVYRVLTVERTDAGTSITCLSTLPLPVLARRHCAPGLRGSRFFSTPSRLGWKTAPGGTRGGVASSGLGKPEERRRAQLCPILAPVRVVAGKLKTGGGREPPRVLEHGVTLYWPQYRPLYWGQYGAQLCSCAQRRRPRCGRQLGVYYK